MSIFKKGENYFIRYRDSEGRQRERKCGPSRKLAEEVERKILLDRTREKLLDIKLPEKVTLEEFAPRYLEYSRTNKRPKMYVSEKNSLNHLLPVFGKKLLTEIAAAEVEEYKAARLADAVKPASVNREIACLRTMLNKAVEWGKLSKNPLGYGRACKVKALKEPPGRVRYLTRDEIARLLEVSPSHLKLIVFFALNTGMRKGEILGLKWADLDLQNCIIHVKETKSGERRDIPVSPELKVLLEGLPRKNEFVLGGFQDVKKSFTTACRKAGIEDFRFHDTRHTFASLLVMAGVPILVVKELLGHKTLRMTERYSHLAPDARKAAIEALKIPKGKNL
jgi:integrase